MDSREGCEGYSRSPSGGASPRLPQGRGKVHKGSCGLVWGTENMESPPFNWDPKCPPLPLPHGDPGRGWVPGSPQPLPLPPGFGRGQKLQQLGEPRFLTV